MILVYLRFDVKSVDSGMYIFSLVLMLRRHWAFKLNYSEKLLSTQVGNYTTNVYSLFTVNYCVTFATVIWQ